MPSHFELPAWMQYIVAISSLVASLGVIVALVQIYITKQQFNKQLAITTNQFTLSNQGYLYMDVNATLYSPDLQPGTPMRPGISYQSIAIGAAIENTGNMPVVFYPLSSKIFFNGVEVYSLPVDTIGSSVSYPKQKSYFGMGQTPFNVKQELLTIDQIQSLRITCKFKFNYHDFNSKHVKTIERTLVVSVNNFSTSGVYKHILDRL
jgi:hypothetical protein